MRRQRPTLGSMERRAEHSYEHRGQTGKYGTIFKGDVDVTRWNPKVGQHEFCIIPFLVGNPEDSPFRRNRDLNEPFSREEVKEKAAWDHKLTILRHSNIGINKDGVLCLRTIGEKCPACEEAEKLSQEGASDEEVGKFSPGKKAIYNVVVFDTDAEFGKGIQVWEAPHQSMEDVLSELRVKVDRRTGEKTVRAYNFPEEGWNVEFERLGAGLSTEYKQVDIVVRREKEDFAQEELNDLYEMAHDFEDIIEIKSYDEFYEMIHGEAPGATETRERGETRTVAREERASEPGREERTERERTSRFRRESSKDEEPVKDARRTEDTGRRLPLSAQKKDPECFGRECNRRTECDDCPEKLFERCYEEQQKNQEDIPF